MVYPDVSHGKASACNAGDLGLIPELGRPPGEGSGHSLQYSCLENSTGTGVWVGTVHRLTKSQTRLSDQHFHFFQLSNANIETVLDFKGSKSEDIKEKSKRTSAC